MAFVQSAHYPTPVPVPAGPIGNRGHRECDCCGMVESTLTGRFALCSGCKFVQYCSKDCQRNHWPQHRALCRHNSATLEEARALARSVPEDFPSKNIMTSMRKFCANHCLLLAWTVYQALELRRMPSNIRQKALLIEVAYSPRAPLRFTLSRANVVSRAQLAQYASNVVLEDVAMREERARRAGGLGVAVVLLVCGGVCEVMPVEIDSLSRIAVWQPRDDWEDIFEAYVASGRLDFQPPLVPAPIQR